MSEGLLFLKPCEIVARHETPCTDFDVNEGKPNGRTIGRIYHAPTRAEAMLALKHRWRERGPLKPGEMQVGTPQWMKDRPEYKHVID
jgi:hypothetical protein